MIVSNNFLLIFTFFLNMQFGLIALNAAQSTIASKVSTTTMLEWKNALVINGSGSKTNDIFDLNNHTLITPDDLQNSYVLGFDPDRHLQKNFRRGLVKPLKNGTWTIYGKAFSTQRVRDIIIKPWKKKELQTFTKRILTDPELWSYQDNEKGLYFDRDPKAVLVVKKNNGTYSYLNTNQAKHLFEAINHKKYNFIKDGIPLFIYAPKIGKIKILTTIRLSEILSHIQTIDGDKLVLLIAGNASHSINKTLSLRTKEKYIDLSQGNNLAQGKIL